MKILECNDCECNGAGGGGKEGSGVKSQAIAPSPSPPTHPQQRGEHPVVKEHQRACGSASLVTRKNGWWGQGDAAAARAIPVQRENSIRIFPEDKETLTAAWRKSIMAEIQSASGSAAWVDRKNGLRAGVQGRGEHFQAVERNPFIS